MLKKHHALLEYLQRHNTLCTSAQIAHHLHISTRSVKSYIKEINHLFDQPIILASPKGYRLASSFSPIPIQEEPPHIPQTYNERSAYILKKLLLDEEVVDLAQLCEALCISDSTLKTILVKLNKAYSNYHVKFNIQKDTVTVSGKEKDKRRLISSCIFEETDNGLLSLSLLKTYFPFFHVEEVRNHILSIFQQHHYYIDDFALMNLLLHLLININRIIEQNRLDSEQDTSVEIESSPLFITHLCQYIEQEFNILLDKEERLEIEMLIQANAAPYAKDQSNIIDTQLLQFATAITDKVNEHYAVNLKTAAFLVPFALHLKKLFVRTTQNRSVNNPLCEDIKRSCPIIYDIAVFVSMQIQKEQQLSKRLSEEEIAYLSLHIGAELERQKVDLPKLKCALLCPEYMGFQEKLYHHLLFLFHDELVLLPPVSDEKQLEQQHFDILFTTIPLHAVYASCSIVPLSLLKENINKRMISSVIDSIKSKRKYKVLKSYFSQFFFPDLFFLSEAKRSKKQVLQFLLDTLKTKGYINQDFIDALYDREQACPTNFNDFAIPHSIKMNAEKSCISVYIATKGIEWAKEKTIHIVYLIAINKADQLIFKDLYETLIHLLNDNEFLSEVIRCSNFAQFKKTMLTAAHIQRIS